MPGRRGLSGGTGRSGGTGDLQVVFGGGGGVTRLGAEGRGRRAAGMCEGVQVTTGPACMEVWGAIQGGAISAHTEAKS